MSSAKLGDRGEFFFTVTQFCFYRNPPAASRTIKIM